MGDLVKRLRERMTSHELHYVPDALSQEAADEIERLRALVRVSGIVCEECGGAPSFVDQDDWAWCSKRCMEKMEARFISEPSTDG